MRICWFGCDNGKRMATDIALDTSPASAMNAMRGLIIDARLGYPQVLHLSIRDSEEQLWQFATQDAEWSPGDPEQLVDRSIEEAEIEPSSRALRLRLSDGTVLEVKPGSDEEKGDPPYWELLTPFGQVLEFGPGIHWQISSADAQASSGS